MAKKKDRYIFGLDIGTHKVCAIVAEITDEGRLDVIGIGQTESKGLRKGVVINLEATVDSIKRVVEEAELMAGVEIGSAYVGIAGIHVRSFNSRGVVAAASKNRVIDREDIRRAIEAAKAVSIPIDRSILHVLPQEFVVDDQDGIGDPSGMTGTRLEVNVHVVTCSQTSAQNTVTCVNRAGLEVIDTVLTQLAAAEACLTPDEKELGVAIVDIGAGTTDLAIFEKGSLWHTAVLQVGGEHFTNDVAVALRTPVGEAEKIKKKHGCALTSMVPEEDSIEVPSVGGRKPRIMARQGDLPAGADGDPARRLRPQPEQRRGADGRRRDPRGHARDRGAALRHAGAARHALRHRRAGRRGGEPGLLDGGRAGALRLSQPDGALVRRQPAGRHRNLRTRGGTAQDASVGLLLR
jgi:cell division protein FtsA